MRRTGICTTLVASVSLLAGCGDDDGTGTATGPAHDLLFAGEVGGTQVLMRTEGAERTVRRIGLGYPGIGATTDPAGSRLLFTTIGAGAEPPRLAVLDSVRAEPRYLTTDAGIVEREPDWAPTGDRVVYTSFADDAYGDVMVARVAGGLFLNATNLTGTNGGAGSPDMTATWSPDGSHIAFTSYRAGSPSIWIMNADGSSPRRLTTPGNASDYFPTWSPAGDSIAFQRIDGVTSRIGLVAVAGGTPRFLALPGDAFTPSWSPVAPQLAIAMRMETLDLDIHVVGTDGTIVERVQRTGNDYEPRWIPGKSRF